MNCNKYITLTLFICLLCTICFFLLKWLFDMVSKKATNGNGNGNGNEYFYTKRNTRIKIYRSDEIFDPDEQPEFEDYDPDDVPMEFDPNQQPYLDDEEIGIQQIPIFNENINNGNNRQNNRENRKNRKKMKTL